MAPPVERPAVPSLLRELNERIVLEALRERGSLSRADLARITELSKPTVSAAVARLVAAGLVGEAEVASGRPGRAGVLYEAVPDAGFLLGFDVDTTVVRGAIADLAGTVLAQLEVPLGSSAPNDILRVLRDLHRRLLADAHARPDRVQIAVVGTPGVVDAATGELRMVGDASELTGVDVVAALQLALGVRVMVENDVNLATLGEQAEGHGRDVNDFAVVSIGSGLGAGLVLGGELHRGATGAAGEIDLIPFGDADPSQIGIHADAIARYVAAVVAVLDVQLIVLAGSFGCRRELLEPVRAAVGQYLPSAVRLESSRLGDGAVLTGALALARRHGLELVTVRLTRANAAPIEERSA